MGLIKFNNKLGFEIDYNFRVAFPRDVIGYWWRMEGDDAVIVNLLAEKLWDL